MYCHTSPDEPWKTRVFLREYSKRGVFFGESWKGGFEKESWNMIQLWYKLVLHEFMLILFWCRHTRCFQQLLLFPCTGYYSNCNICLHGNSASESLQVLLIPSSFERQCDKSVFMRSLLHWMSITLFCEKTVDEHIWMCEHFMYILFWVFGECN